MFTIEKVADECETILDENKCQTKNEIESQKEIDIIINPVNSPEKKLKNPRKWLIKIIQSPWFERVSMFVIIFNCITLGMYKPCEDQLKCASTRCFILEYLDHAIYVFFLIEMLIKILAMGFIGKNTYLAESWNILDFFIVLER